MSAIGYKKLNMDLITKKPSRTISSDEALRDSTPIKWSDDVLSGKKKVVLDSHKKGKVCAE